MKEEKIKSLPLVKEFSNYFVRRGKRVLGLKKSEYDYTSIDITGSGKIWVWFFGSERVIAWTQFYQDGRFFCRVDNRLGG